MNSSLLVEMRGGSKYNDKKLTPGSKYHMENWSRGQNIIGKSTPGSIYHGVQNTIWHHWYFMYSTNKCTDFNKNIINKEEKKNIMLSWNQYYTVSKWIELSTCGQLFQWASTKKNPTKHIGLIQNRHYLIKPKLWWKFYLKPNQL